MGSERVRLGMADGKVRHWLYVCPECGTHYEERVTCEGFGPDDEHDPAQTVKVSIVDAKDYDELDEKLARTEAERDSLQAELRGLREAGNVVARNLTLCVEAIVKHLADLGVSPDDFAPLREIQEKGESSVARWMQVAFRPQPDTPDQKGGVNG